MAFHSNYGSILEWLK